MEENGRERRVRSGPGLLATLLGGFVLVVIGFALGLVVGALREEPGLVVRHFAGESQEVPLAQPGTPEPGIAPAAEASGIGAPAQPEAGGGFRAGTSAPSGPATGEAGPSEPAPLGAPEAGAAAPRALPAEPPAEELAARQAPVASPPSRPTPPPVSARPPAPGGFAVQVGAFRDGPQAEQLAARLRGKGFSTYVAPGSAAPDSRWRVRVGPVGTRGEAEQLASRLKSDEKLPTWVLDASR